MIMTATLTDHYGAITPRAFDADNPDRPIGDPQYAADRAEFRLWGGTTFVPGVGNRRMAAVGWNSNEEGVHLQADYVFTENGTAYVATWESA